MPEVIDPIKPTVEDSICSKWGDARSTIKDRLKDGESYVRQEPLKAVAYAATAGYVLRILPIGAIIRSIVKLLLLAVKPAAVLYGAAKAYEIIVSSKKS